MTEINFNEKTTSRLDLNGPTAASSLIADNTNIQAYALDNIEIKPLTGGKYCKEFTLNTSYFDSKVIPTYTFEKRLKLNSVQELVCGTIDEPIAPYTFTYNSGGGGIGSNIRLPSRFDKAVDAWGHFNGAMGNNNEDFNIPSTNLHLYFSNAYTEENFGNADRSVSEDNMRLGVLSSITFPEGGKTELDFEANTVQDSTYTPLGFPPLGIWPSLETCDYDQLDFTECCLDSQGAAVTEITASSTYNITQKMYEQGAFKIYLKDAGCVDDEDPQGNYVTGIANLYIRLPGTSTDAAEPQSFDEQFNRPYTFAEEEDRIFELKDLFDPSKGYFFTPGNYEIKIGGITGAVRLEYLQRNKVYLNEKVGGLRVKEIRTYDEDNILADKRSYNYDKPSNGYSSGALYREPKFGFYNGTILQEPGLEIFYFARTWQSSSVWSLTDINGNHIGYENVKESKDNGAYSTFFYNAESVGEYLGPYPFIPEDYKYDNGNLKSKKQHEDGDALVMSDSSVHSTPSIPGVGDRLALRATMAVNGSGGGGNSITPILAASFSYQNPGFSRLSESINVLDGLTTTTTFGYSSDTPFRPVAQNVINSDGKEYTTATLYAANLTGSVYETMVSDFNMVGVPIENRLEVNNIVVRGDRTEYSLVGGKPYPQSIQKCEKTYDENGNLVFDGDCWNTVGTFGTYLNGLPLSFTRRGWLPETYEWYSSGRLKSRTYDDFMWQYNYFTNTRLVQSIINHDGQITNFDYDNYGRLTTSNARNGNITTNYGYFYPDGTRTGFEKAHVKTEAIYTPVTGSDLSNRTTFTYIDGLGRVKQVVDSAYSSGPIGQAYTPKDVVQSLIYDQYGQQTQTSEKFESPNSSGAFVPSIPSGIFTETKNYEESPLNRISGVLPPDWPYETKSEYGRNETSITVGSYIYAIGELKSSTIIDPNNPNWKTIESHRYTLN